MAIQPVYENVRLNLKKKTAVKQIKIEAKTEIIKEAIGKILDVSAFIGQVDTEVLSGKIVFNGKAIFNVVFETEDALLRKYEYAVNFADEIFDAEIVDGSEITIKTVVEKCGNTNGASVTVFAYVIITAEISCYENVNFITGGEDVIVNTAELEYLSAYGLKQSPYLIEEEFELNYQVAEMLSHRVCSSITAVQCGVGCIIIDGETVVSALLLQNDNKSDIIKEERVIPFRAEIEYDEAMPSMRSIASVKEKAFKSDIIVDEETGKSSVTYTVTLGFSVEAYSPEKLNVISDAFSLTEKTDVVFFDCAFSYPFDVRTDRIKVSARVPAPEIPAGSKIMAVGGEKVEITERVQTEKGLKLNGVVSLKAYFRDGDGKNFAVSFEAPFEEIVDCILPLTAKIDVDASVYHGGVRIISFTEAEIMADVTVSIYGTEQCAKQYVKEIRSLGDKPVNEHAISVYIPVEGEELWSLAKRLNVSPERLCETNRDLQFPLTGKERILVYRQK